MVLKLYFDFLSQPSRVLYIFLKVCNVPFESHNVRIAYGENQTEDYEAINPFSKLPAIEHNGFKLIESVAIARYLCREFKVADHWYPKESKGQAQVDEFLEWQHTNVRLNCARHFLAAVAYPMLRQRAPNAEKLKELEGGVVSCLNDVENKWLKNKLFLIGDKISVADLFAACEIEQTRLSGFDPRQSRSILVKWLERVARETAPYYDEAHGHIDEVIVRLGGRPPYTCNISDIYR